jgi:hypothetical protein
MAEIRTWRLRPDAVLRASGSVPPPRAQAPKAPGSDGARRNGDRLRPGGAHRALEPPSRAEPSATAGTTDRKDRSTFHRPLVVGTLRE